MNPFVTCENSFGGFFWVGSDSDFLDYFWVNRVVCTDESMHHLWKQFRGLFLSGQRLSFPWLFLSQQGLYAMMNLCVSSGKHFLWWFLIGQPLYFPWLVLIQLGLCGLMNQCVTSQSSFGDDFWVGSDSVFLDSLCVNRGSVRWWIQASVLETFFMTISEWTATPFSLTLSESTGDECADKSMGQLWKRVSVMIFDVAATQFSLTIFESIGAVCAEESMRHLWKQFRGLFLSRQRLSFPWLFLSQQGLCGLTNPFVTYESRFGGYFWVGTDSVFLDSFLVSGAVCADESMDQLLKHFRWRFLIGRQLSFPWVFLCQQGQCALRIPCITSESSFEGYFLSGQRLSFPWLFPSQQGLCGLINPCNTSRRSFGDDF